MKTWKQCAAGLVALASWTPGLLAQPPAVPPAVAPVAGPPAPGGLWTFLGLSKPQLAECRDKICKSQIGQLINSGMAPIRTFTGGLMPSCCPVASRADLAKPADSAEGAAARIAADEAGAKARRAAVRYLGTVDCHYWPEAEAGLINALRTDKNECVRMEAAWALGSGCCCTKKTVEALSITVSGSDRDGHAAEKSDRVKEAARFALERCVACFNSKCAAGEQLPAPKEQAPKEKAENTAGKPKQPAVPYYEKISTEPAEDIYDRARKLLEKGYTPENYVPDVLPTTHKSDHSLYNVVRTAFGKAGTQGTTPALATVRATPRPSPAPTTQQLQASMNLALSQNMPKPNGAVLFPNTVVAWRPASRPQQVATAAAEQPRGLIEAVRNRAAGQQPSTTVQVVEPEPVRMPEARVVSVERPVDRPAQALPAAATAYRTITYHKPADKGVQQASHQLPPGTFLPQLLDTLQRGNEAERTWAAQGLCGVDSRAHPEVIQALANASRVDPAPTVRASCVRCLAELNAGTPEVVHALHTLQGDANDDVRAEVQKALIKLGR